MTCAHSAECDGYLYPDDPFVEARYALDGTIAENPSATVTMRHCLSCYAQFHLVDGQPRGSTT